MSGRFSQNDLVKVTREIEVTEGVIVGGSRLEVFGTAPTWSASGNSNTSGINTGAAGIQGVRAALRFANVEIPSQLVFGMNDKEIEDVLRDAFPADELTFDDTFTFAAAGTQVDGSTGPIITAAAGTFDDLFDTADFVGLMMEVSGAAIHADNKHPRVIKDVKPDGSQIDINPLYAVGSSPAFRCALHSEASKAGTIRLGKWVRNRSIENRRSVNFEFNYTDQPGGSFVIVRGCSGASMKISFTGKGNVEISFMYEGMDYSELSTTSAGSGVTVNPNVLNEVFSSGEDLVHFCINGVTELAGENITSFNLDLNGNVQGIDDVAGSRFRPGTTAGDIDATGSLKIYHKEALSAVLQTLGFTGNKAPLDFKLQDPDGNFIWGILPAVLFEPNGPKPGAKGSKTDNTINYKTQLGRNGERTFIYQTFAAS